MSQNDSRSVQIKLDISVPIGAEIMLPGAKAPPKKDGGYGFDITHPDSNGTTYVDPDDYMCAYGITDSTRHVFAIVYESNNVPSDLSKPPYEAQWIQAENFNWKFPQLPVPGTIGPGQTKALVVWEESDPDTYNHLPPRTFTALANTYTYCELYGLNAQAATAKKPAAKDWSTLPDRWQFHIAGAANASAPNCGCLNGSWLLKRDGQNLLWGRKLDTSFADPKRPSWWRLSFNPKDGFVYLECVTDPGQPFGVSIAYRRHETAFDPRGANEMALLTCHGYCHVPEFVTISPA